MTKWRISHLEAGQKYVCLNFSEKDRLELPESFEPLLVIICNQHNKQIDQVPSEIVQTIKCSGVSA